MLEENLSMSFFCGDHIELELVDFHSEEWKI